MDNSTYSFVSFGSFSFVENSPFLKFLENLSPAIFKFFLIVGSPFLNILSYFITLFSFEDFSFRHILYQNVVILYLLFLFYIFFLLMIGTQRFGKASTYFLSSFVNSYQYTTCFVTTLYTSVYVCGQLSLSPLVITPLVCALIQVSQYLLREFDTVIYQASFSRYATCLFLFVYYSGIILASMLEPSPFTLHYVSILWTLTVYNATPDTLQASYIPLSMDIPQYKVVEWAIDYVYGSIPFGTERAVYRATFPKPIDTVRGSYYMFDTWHQEREGTRPPLAFRSIVHEDDTIDPYREMHDSSFRGGVFQWVCDHTAHPISYLNFGDFYSCSLWFKNVVTFVSASIGRDMVISDHGIKMCLSWLSNACFYNYPSISDATVQSAGIIGILNIISGNLKIFHCFVRTAKAVKRFSCDWTDEHYHVVEVVASMFNFVKKYGVQTTFMAVLLNLPTAEANTLAAARSQFQGLITITIVLIAYIITLLLVAEAARTFIITYVLALQYFLTGFDTCCRYISSLIRRVFNTLSALPRHVFLWFYVSFFGYQQVMASYVEPDRPHKNSNFSALIYSLFAICGFIYANYDLIKIAFKRELDKRTPSSKKTDEPDVVVDMDVLCSKMQQCEHSDTDHPLFVFYACLDYLESIYVVRRLISFAVGFNVTAKKIKNFIHFTLDLYVNMSVATYDPPGLRKTAAWANLVLSLTDMCTEMHAEELYTHIMKEEPVLQSSEIPIALLQLSESYDRSRELWKPDIIGPFTAIWVVWTMFLSSQFRESMTNVNWLVFYNSVLDTLAKHHDCTSTFDLLDKLVKAVRSCIWWGVTGYFCDDNIIKHEKSWCALNTAHNNIQNGSYLKITDDPRQYIVNVEANAKLLIIHLDLYSRTSTIDRYTRDRIRLLKKECIVIEDGCARRLENITQKNAPFVITLYGEAGVGKSFLASAVAKLIHESTGSKRSFKLTSLPDGAKHDDGLTNETTCILLDDFGQSSKDGSPDNTAIGQRLFRAVSPMAAKAVMADVRDKGKVFFNNISTVITTNFSDCKVSQFCGERGAGVRRLGICIKVSLKKEFSSVGESGVRMLDASKAPKGEFITSALTFRQYTINTSDASSDIVWGVGEESYPIMEADEFIAFIRTKVEHHVLAQKDAFNNSANSLSCARCGGIVTKQFNSCKCIEIVPEVKNNLMIRFLDGAKARLDTLRGIEPISSSDLCQDAAPDDKLEAILDNIANFIPYNWSAKYYVTALMAWKYGMVTHYRNSIFLVVIASTCYSYTMFAFLWFLPMALVYACVIPLIEGVFIASTLVSIFYLFRTITLATFVLPDEAPEQVRHAWWNWSTVRNVVPAFLVFLLGFKLVRSWIARRVHDTLQSTVETREAAVTFIPPDDKPWAKAPILPKPIAGHKIQTTSSIDQVEYKLKHNMVKITIMPQGKNTQFPMYGLCVDSLKVITISHSILTMLDKYKDCQKFNVRFSVYRDDLWEDVDLTAHRDHFVVHDHKDLAMINLCPLNRAAMTLRDFLLPTSLKDNYRFPVRWLKNSTPDGPIFSQPCEAKQTTSCTKLYESNAVMANIRYKAIHVEGAGSTYEGVCGTPIFCVNAPRAIVGLHTYARNGMSTGNTGCVPVTQEDITWFEGRLGCTHLVSMKDTGLTAYGNTPVSIDETCSDIHPKSPANFLSFPTVLCGTVPSTYSDKGRIDPLPSAPYINMVFPGAKNYLAGTENNPTKVYRKFITMTSETCGIPQQFLEWATADLLAPLQECKAKFESVYGLPKPLTSKETANGGNVYGLQHINFNASAGFGYKGKKSEYFEGPDGEKDFTQFLLFEIEEVKRKLLTGYAAGHINNVAIKIEPKAPDANGNKKMGRTFAVADVVLATLTKQYLGPVVAFFNMFAPTFDTALGVDMTSSNCQACFSSFFECDKTPADKKYWSCDFSCYDSCHGHTVLNAVCNMILAPCKEWYTNHDFLIAKCVLAECIKPYMRMKGIIVNPYSGMPSGIYVTSLANSFVHALIVRCSFYKAYLDKGTTMAIGCYRDYCITRTFGDDGINRMTHRNQDSVWNPSVFSSHCSEWDYKATNPQDKLKPCTYCAVDDLQFLSRTIGWHSEKNHLVGYLSKDSLVKMCTTMVRNNKVSVYDVQLACLQNFVLEMSNYSKIDYETAQRIVEEICFMISVPFSNSRLCLPYEAHIKTNYYVANGKTSKDFDCKVVENVNIGIVRTQEYEEALDFFKRETIRPMDVHRADLPDSLDEGNDILCSTEQEGGDLVDSTTKEHGTLEIQMPSGESAGIAVAPFNFPGDDGVSGMGKFDQRPYLIRGFDLVLNRIETFLLDPYYELMKQAAFRARIANHTYYRCNIKLTVHFIASKEIYGALSATYYPLCKRANFYPSGDSVLDTLLDSTMSQTIFDVSQTASFDYMIPFIYPFPMRSTETPVEGEAGYFQLRSLGTLQSISSTGPSTVAVRIYATIEDLVLGGPSTTKLQAFPEEKISSTLTKMGELASAGSNLLVGTGGYLPSQLVSKGLIAAGGIASGLGYSRPRQTEFEETLSYGTVANPANSAGISNARMLAVDKFHETAINPSVTGLYSGDTLTAANMSGEPTVIAVMFCSSSDKTGKVLFTAPVNPAYYKSSRGKYAFPRCSAYALCYNFWHGGTICYRFTVIKHPSHGGVLSAIHDPAPDTTGDITHTRHYKLDLRTDNVLEVRVSWATNKPALLVAYPTANSPIDSACANGYISLCIDTPIISTGTNAASVCVMVEYWWEDVEFYSPTNSFWSNFNISEVGSNKPKTGDRFFVAGTTSQTFGTGNVAVVATAGSAVPVILPNVSVIPITPPTATAPSTSVTGGTIAATVPTQAVPASSAGTIYTVSSIKDVTAPSESNWLAAWWPAMKVIPVTSGMELPKWDFYGLRTWPSDIQYTADIPVWADKGIIILGYKGGAPIELFDPSGKSMGIIANNSLTTSNGIITGAITFSTGTQLTGLVTIRVNMLQVQGLSPEFLIICFVSLAPKWISSGAMNATQIRTSSYFVPSPAAQNTDYKTPTVASRPIDGCNMTGVTMTIPYSAYHMTTSAGDATFSCAIRGQFSMTANGATTVFNYPTLTAIILRVSTGVTIVGMTGCNMVAVTAYSITQLQATFEVSGNNLDHTLIHKHMAGDTAMSLRPLLKVMQDPLVQTIDTKTFVQANSFVSRGSKTASIFNIFTLSHLGISGSMCFMVELLSGGPLSVSSRDPTGSVTSMTFQILKQGGQNLFMYEVPYYAREHFMIQRGVFSNQSAPIWGPTGDMADIGLSCVGLQLLNYGTTPATIRTWIAAGESFNLAGFCFIPILESTTPMVYV